MQNGSDSSCFSKDAGQLASADVKDSPPSNGHSQEKTLAFHAMGGEGPNTKDGGDADPGGEEEEQDQFIEMEQVRHKPMIYSVSESPPWRMLIICILQQGLLPVSSTLSISVLVTELVCGRSDGQLKTMILSSTFAMVGLSTFVLTTFGIRLPIFQGPSSPYIIPLFALSALPEWQCPDQGGSSGLFSNASTNGTVVQDDLLVQQNEQAFLKLRQLSGSLILAGGLHFLIGATGMIGYLLRFIGPITIVPSITLIGLYIYKIAVKFSETNWFVAILVAAIGIILSLYLGKKSSPIPAWNRERGFHIKWFPIHQVFAILIATLIGWGVSGIMTAFDLLSSDPNSVQFYARTDTQLDIIHNTPWFSLPYPGQFGVPSFHAGVFLNFFFATLMSVLDSIGDYNACAGMCRVPKPPAWAVNRGVALEGLMSLLSGAFGVGHATVSYGSSIGAIGLTKVSSRRVFQGVGLMYMLLAVVSKAGAVIITVPYAVLGGTQIIGTGIFVGIVLSNLQHVDLRSNRNLAIIGISLIVGLMMPYWVTKSPDAIRTGSAEVDRLIEILLTNPIFSGGLLACLLDNTVPGTLKERGISTDEYRTEPSSDEETDKDTKDAGDDSEEEFIEGIEVYDFPWQPRCLHGRSLSKVFRTFASKRKGHLVNQEAQV